MLQFLGNRECFFYIVHILVTQLCLSLHFTCNQNTVSATTTLILLNNKSGREQMVLTYIFRESLSFLFLIILYLPLHLQFDTHPKWKSLLPFNFHFDMAPISVLKEIIQWMASYLFEISKTAAVKEWHQREKREAAYLFIFQEKCQMQRSHYMNVWTTS